MKSFFFLSLSTICIFFVSACYKEQVLFTPTPNKALELPLILNFDNKSCFFDENTMSFRYSIATDSIFNFSPWVTFQEHATIFINDIQLTNNAINHLGKVKVNETYTIRIITQNNTEHFTLKFTILPLLRIVTDNQIADEPKSLARLTVNDPHHFTSLTSFIGIELRGASSQFNPKKSYGFSFLQNNNIKDKVSKSILRCKKNENWILDAVYNDPSKLRNKLSFEIWKTMNPTEHQAIESQFVEVYINNSYQGLYCLNEQINAEQIGLSNSEGGLYKSVNWSSGTTFQSFNIKTPPKYSDFWNGWIQKHPNPKHKIYWQPLDKLRNWIMHTTDEQFIKEVSDQINLENIIDYYLFTNLIGANDNHGKNMFWVSFSDNTPLSIIPWDLDTSWGRDWDAKPRSPSLVSIYTNKLFQRLLTLNPQNFKEKIKKKWLKLRTNAWLDTHLQTLLDETIKPLLKLDIAEQEQMRWGKAIDLEQERIYIHNWMTYQFNLLDIYFNSF